MLGLVVADLPANREFDHRYRTPSRGIGAKVALPGDAGVGRFTILEEASRVLVNR